VTEFLDGWSGIDSEERHGFFAVILLTAYASQQVTDVWMTEFDFRSGMLIFHEPG
jgi:hypothetical protein